MSEAKLTLVPHYLKASSPDLLLEEMLSNNVRLGSQIKYQDINELKDGSFICWYYEEINLEQKIEQAKE